MKRKVLLVASVFAFHGSFHHDLIKYLYEHNYDITVASKNKNISKVLGDYGQLDDLKISKKHIPFSRSPFSFKTLNAYKEILKIIVLKLFILRMDSIFTKVLH